MNTRPSGRHRPRPAAIVAAMVALGLVAAACGGDSAPAARPATEADDTTGAKDTDDTRVRDTDDAGADTTDGDEGDVTSSGSDGGAIGAIDDAQSGAIQIIAQGSLRDPEIGTYTSGSSGSGFFISADGYAVTNNHVVTGAATLEVYVGGDLSTSYNAQVVGVSECNDLALIKVESSDDVPYFDWHDDEVKAGLDVYAAGFPLGDPEFTLTKGIVAKAKAGGDLTGTSSIDHTIEHDAAIQPGNSGGPLLASDGTVVGINYAGGARDIGAQYYAISSDLAQVVIDKLADGDFESLGVNGFAIADEATGITGIWVAGVAAGTPASEVGLLPGDIITAMNGLPVGTDGTFKDYCDVIRTAGSKPMSLQVLRYDSQEILEGEINGDRQLAATVSFGEDAAAESDVEEAADYTDYVSVTDDSGTLTLEVPAQWSDISTSALQGDDGVTYPQIQASSDLNGFTTTWGVPGVMFMSAPAGGDSIESVLDGFSIADQCSDGGITDYSDGVFVGKYQLWENCGGTETIYLVLVTNLVSSADTFYITTVQAVTSADL
ncbi:MAG: trypsin-like peptidase domain-containing protein, partial [Actinobacteria bacterium]|nr:trypsin-like peptidase domain-containing protein [Actinomycetota bacterium]